MKLNDLTYKYLTEEAKKLKRELGLIQSRIPPTENQKELNEAINEAVQNLANGNYTPDAWNRLVLKLTALENCEVDSQLKRSITKAKKAISIFEEYITKKQNSEKSELKESKISDFKLNDIIKKKEEGYVIYSKKGKRLSKPYKTKEEAEKRLKQIEYFKHKGEDMNIKDDKDVIKDSIIKDGHSVRTVEWLDDEVYVEYDLEEKKYYLASDNDRYSWTNFNSVEQAVSFYKYNKNDVRTSILDSVKDDKEPETLKNLYKGIDVMDFCKKYNFYTGGTLSEYNELLDNVGNMTLDQIAEDIILHSNEKALNKVGVGYSTRKMVELLKRNNIRDLIKDEKEFVHLWIVEWVNKNGVKFKGEFDSEEDAKAFVEKHNNFKNIKIIEEDRDLNFLDNTIKDEEKEDKQDSEKIMNIVKTAENALRKVLVQNGYTDNEDIFLDAEFEVLYDPDKNELKVSGNQEWAGSTLEEEAVNKVKEAIYENVKSFEWAKDLAGGIFELK